MSIAVRNYRLGGISGRVLSALAMSTMLSGCAMVNIYGEATVRHQWAFAPLGFEPLPGATAVMVGTARGIGLVPGWRGLTLGYRAEAWAVVADPRDCRVIFFGAPAQLTQDSQIKGLAAQSKGGDICIISNLPVSTP